MTFWYKFTTDPTDDETIFEIKKFNETPDSIKLQYYSSQWQINGNNIDALSANTYYFFAIKVESNTITSATVNGVDQDGVTGSYSTAADIFTELTLCN